MLTGHRFSGDVAQSMGIVSEAVESSLLDARLAEIVNEFRQCSPNALAACKRLIFAVKDAPLDDTVDYRARLLSELRQSDEGQEGMMAFAMKRPPRWAE
jgi:enoyl-CoA hydratase/carnithine racemase